MPQFALYRNLNPASRGRFPLLLDIQSDLLDPLATRIVVPLSLAGAARSRSMTTLTPLLRFESKEYVAQVPQLSAMAVRELGAPVGSLSAARAEILAAIDLLITGI